MPISFPSSPSVNDTYTINGRVYVWTGSKWRRQRPAIASASPSMSVSNNFSAGGSALHVDSTNSSVGIGTSSPNASESLTVGGDTSITGNLSVTGIITVPTQVSTTNDTKVATTEFVQTAISNLIGGAPAALDTLNELAAAINDDSSYAASITTSLAGKSDTSHTHSYAASSHTHSYASTSHTHSYASTSHTHSYASTSSAVRALYHSGYGNSEVTAYQTSGNWQTWTGGWATHIICNHGNGSNYYNQTLIMPFWGQPHYQRKEGGTNRGPWVMYSSENSNNSASNWTIGRAYVHNEVFVYNMDTTSSYNTVRYNTSNSQLMAYASLREMKDDITEINPLLNYLGERSLLYDLKPVIFKESEDRIGKDGQPLHTTRGEYAPGFIAEEVHEVAPELTYFDHKGDLISYSNDALIPHVVAELQRLMPMIEELYSAANPDWVPPAPRPIERAEAEKLVYDIAAAEKAASPTVFEDQPEGSAFLEPDRDLVDPSEVEEG